MGLLDLGACAGPAVEVAQHLGVGIELHLQLEMVVGERNELEAFCQQRRLGHATIISAGGKAVSLRRHRPQWSRDRSAGTGWAALSPPGRGVFEPFG